MIKRQGNNSGSNIDSRKFYLPFILWFIVPNIISLAPWSWDNTKVLVYWLLISTPFVAAGIAFLMTDKNIWMRVVACLLFIGLTFSGATDTVRALTSNDETRLFTNVQIEVAEYLRHNTPPHSIILHAPIHNSVNSLAGRLSVMGYPGHLWTHGIDYATREADVRIIFRGEQGAGKLIAMYKIDYVIIGPGERHLMNVNEQFFDDNYKIIMINGDIKVYQVKK